MPDSRYECQYKVCQACHSLGKEKSWTSLDAVLSGDILPTTATGFGFSHLGVRPVGDANILRNIGLRAVPLVRPPEASSTYPVNTRQPHDHPARPSSPQSSGTSAWRLLDVIEEHPELTPASSSSGSFSNITIENDERTVSAEAQGPQTITPQRLSSHSDRLSVEGNTPGGPDSGDSFAANYAFDEASIRPPWTPPPTPAGATLTGALSRDPAQESPNISGRR